MCSAFATRATQKAFSASSNTFSRLIRTADTLGAAAPAGGAWLDCAWLAAGEVPNAVAARTARPRSDRTPGRLIGSEQDTQGGGNGHGTPGKPRGGSRLVSTMRAKR